METLRNIQNEMLENFEKLTKIMNTFDDYLVLEQRINEHEERAI